MESAATLGVLETTESVLKESRRVRVDREAVAALAEQGADGPPGRDPLGGAEYPRFRPCPWDPRHFQGLTEQETANYILAQDSINYCFWGDPPWEVTYRGRVHRGYWGLVVALRRALEVCCPLADASYLANVSPDDLDFILRGQGRLHLMRERLEALREVGRVLLDRYGGQFEAMIREAGGSAVALALGLAAEFPSFDDRARYRGREVRFFKRAQLCAADLYGAFGGRGLGAFRDLDRLTAFADYELPRVLRHFGVLRYDPELAAAVDGGRVIPAGSEEEIEIRAAAVWAVEYLRRELDARGNRLPAFQIDWVLWEWSQEHPPAAPPHRTLTTYY